MELKNICTNCQLVISNDGKEETIFSYGTPVFSWHGNSYHRLWIGYSATTMRHISKAIGRTITKKEWEGMPVENA